MHQSEHISKLGTPKIVVRNGSLLAGNHWIGCMDQRVWVWERQAIQKNTENFDSDPKTKVEGLEMLNRTLVKLLRDALDSQKSCQAIGVIPFGNRCVSSLWLIHSRLCWDCHFGIHHPIWRHSWCKIYSATTQPDSFSGRVARLKPYAYAS